MMELLVLKERLRAFYMKNSYYLIPAGRFIIAFAAFYLINRNAGFIPKLSGVLIPFLLAAVCACLPYGVIAFLAGAFLLIQLYAASLEVALVVTVCLLTVVLIYFGFQPGDSILLLATPILFFIKIPFLIPILIGLAGSLVSVVPMSCGIFIYYVIMYVKQNSSFLAGSEQTEMTQIFAQVIKSLFANQNMLIMIAACCVGALAVHVVRNLSINYSWGIAITIGVILQLAIVFIGDFRFGAAVSIPEVAIGMVLSGLLAVCYHFFAFAVDYSRTEFLQFEDDDYYYYVKAVPKITVAKPDVKVQKFNKINRQKTMRH